MKDYTAEIDKVFNEDELISLLSDFISIPTYTTYKNREQELAEYIMQICKREGIDAYFQDTDEKGRYNVIATIKGRGNGKSLMYNGHMDTVPIDGMTDPLVPVIKDGYMYGRGTADMKSGLAAMFYSLIMVKRMGIPLEGDFVFAGVIDEEAAKSTGSWAIAKNGPKTDYAIVGEPTALYPVIAHKGIDYFQIDFHGKAAHSSNPDNGVSAIYAASDYVNEIRNVLVPRYKAMVHPKVGHPTINTGLISGSAKINSGYILKTSDTFAGVVPDEASVWVDVRWTPEQSVETIIKDLETLIPAVVEKNPGISIEVSYIPWPRPAMEIGEHEKLTKVLYESVKEVSPETAELQGVSYFADSGILYGKGNILSIIFGPGDIAQAHSINEFVKLSDVSKAARIYAMTALNVCG